MLQNDVPEDSGSAQGRCGWCSFREGQPSPAPSSRRWANESRPTGSCVPYVICFLSVSAYSTASVGALNSRLKELGGKKLILCTSVDRIFRRNKHLEKIYLSDVMSFLWDGESIEDMCSMSSNFVTNTLLSQPAPDAAWLTEFLDGQVRVGQRGKCLPVIWLMARGDRNDQVNPAISFASKNFWDGDRTCL